MARMTPTCDPALVKACKRCLEVLPLAEFSPRPRGLHGVESKCRQCLAAIARERRSADPVAARGYLRKYREANPSKVKEWRRAGRERSLEAHRSRYRNWRESNKVYAIIRCKEWKQENPDKVAAHARTRQGKRRNDPAHALKSRLYSRMRNGLCGKSHGRIEEIGCTAECFRKHIELLFPEGMGWHNMQEWSLDHFYPLAAIGKNPDWLSVAAACNYRNLRPTWKRANASKRDVVFQDAVALFEAIKDMIKAGVA